MDIYNCLYINPIGHVPLEVWKKAEIAALRLLAAVATPMDNNEKQKHLWAITVSLLIYEKKGKTRCETSPTVIR